MKVITAVKLMTLALVLCYGILSAAQSQIFLGQSTQNVTFTGQGAGDPTEVGVQLGNCVAGTCTLSGTGAGTGLLLSGPAAWSITSAQNSLFISETITPGVFSTSGPAVSFCYGGTGTCNGSLLTGNLTLEALQQVSGTKTGEFNTFQLANLQVTGGSLASVFGGTNGVATISLKFAGSTDLSLLFGTTNSVSGPVDHGGIVPSPEPASMALFGSGLLTLGGLIRRKLS